MAPKADITGVEAFYSSIQKYSTGFGITWWYITFIFRFGVSLAFSGIYKNVSR